jgi:hypothetical protein
VISEGRFDEGTDRASGSMNQRYDLELSQRSQMSPQLLVESHGQIQLNRLRATYLQDEWLQETPSQLGQDLVHDDGSSRFQLRWSHALDRGLFDAGLSGERRLGGPWAVGVQLQQSHLSPSLSDRLGRSPNFQGNPGLLDERSRQAEAWISSTELGSFAWQVSASANWTSNLIESSQLTDDIWTKTNRSEALVLQVELAAQTGLIGRFLGASWRGSIFLTAADGQDLKSRQALFRMARRAGALSVDGQWHRDLEAGIQVSGTDGKAVRTFDGSEVSIDQPIDLDLRIRYGALRFAVDHLLDRPSQSQPGWPREQRQFRIEYIHSLASGAEN